MVIQSDKFLSRPLRTWHTHGYYDQRETQKEGFLFIAAYIAVQKGSDIGIKSLYAQQITLYERECNKSKKLPDSKYCPQKAAIIRLDEVIHSLQLQHHDIVLMLDANQASQECYLKESICPHSIEWLHLQRGMDDPFITLTGHWPNSTTQTPGRDIDYILPFDISISNITTIPINCPAISDHLGIIMDINLASHFSSVFSEPHLQPSWSLTSGNEKSVDSYLAYAHKQIDTHNIINRLDCIYNAIKTPTYNLQRSSLCN